MSMDELQIGAGTELAILGEHSAVAVDAKGAKCQRCSRVLKHGFVLDGFVYGPVCVRKMGGVVVAVSRSKTNKVEVETTNDQLSYFDEELSVPVSRYAARPAKYRGFMVGMSAETEMLGETDDTVVMASHEGSEYKLPLCLEIVNHSPTGFSWGYCGSGPHQTALAILVDYFQGNVELAKKHYNTLVFKKISGYDQLKEFILTGDQIQEVLGGN